MQKLLLLIALCFLCTLSLAAQQGPPPPQPPKTSPPTPERNPALWKEYSFSEDNVRFRFPVEPVVEQDSIESGGNKMPVRRYKRGAFMRFYVDVTDQNTRKMETNIAKSTDFLDILVAATAGTNKVLKKELVNIDGHPGMFFAYETNDDHLVRGKLFVVGTKVYVAGTDIRKGPPIGFNAENNFELPAMAFLDSIHLISK
jgi:hypothetical protein